MPAFIVCSSPNADAFFAGLPKPPAPILKEGYANRPRGAQPFDVVEATGWWTFPPAATDDQVRAELAARGYSPEGFGMPVIGAYGGWKVVEPLRIARKGSRVLATQHVRIDYH